MDYQSILREIESEVKDEPKSGKVASYIPELGNIEPNKLGMHLCCFEKGQYAFGDHEERFSIQSISKVFSLTMYGGTGTRKGLTSGLHRKSSKRVRQLPGWV